MAFGSRLRTAGMFAVFAAGLVFAGIARGEVLRLGDGHERYVPGPYMEVLEDPRQTLAIGDVTAPNYASRFSRYDRQVLDFGLSSSAYWIRLTIAGDASGTQWFLTSDRPFISSFQVYFPEDTAGVATGGWSIRGLGFSDVRRGPVSSLSLELPPVSAAPRTIYLRIADGMPLFLPLEITTAGAMAENARNRMFLIGAYLGIMFALALFNGSLFILLRDRSYLWYVVYLVCVSLFFFFTGGMPSESLLPVSPVLSVRFGLCLAMLSIGAIGMFARTFLFASRIAPVVNQLFRVMAALSVFFGALCWVFPLRPLMGVLSVFGMAVPVLLIVSAAICLRRGFYPARYFLLAWIFLGVGTMLFVLTSDGVIPFSIYGFLGMQIGTAAEAVLLSFALADRIRTLRSEREEALRKERHSQELALTDSLTGLYNARHFHERMEIDSRWAESSRQPLSLLMIDVDNFKRFNDTHGHPEGDRILGALGETILASIRENDTAFRCGGEEFSVLLRGSPGGEALRVAERLRESWERRIPVRGEALSFSPTLSIGVCEFVSGRGRCDMIIRADRALYRAKRKGKNRCETESAGGR